MKKERSVKVCRVEGYNVVGLEYKLESRPPRGLDKGVPFNNTPHLQELKSSARGSETEPPRIPPPGPQSWPVYYICNFLGKLCSAMEGARMYEGAPASSWPL